MTPDELEVHTDTLDFINNEIAARLDRQFDSLDKIDSKAALVVGYALAAASFLATRHAQAVLAGFAFCGFGVAAICGILALAVSNYQDVAPRGLLHYAESSRSATIAAMTANRVMIFEINSRRQRAKAKQWMISLAALFLATALMVTAILVHT